jgi:hypothetical protein
MVITLFDTLVMTSSMEVVGSGVEDTIVDGERNTDSVFSVRARALSDRTESIWDSQRAVVVIQTGCWIEEASDE